ncbi:hypothetical protein ASE36_02110 [Rhizobium sp. Root274]|uniref:hypothetical protein n=1 Tax=unclassified Rhizobium TaxID=2613769 RepID=UPI0007135D10|nr:MULTISPECIES: hypothetical protein [unclassified Rhizobium]KQW31103.1 hypothetical protein ASC71_02110 [Rhizobium sp. Root1240]KRD32651.1 hypothetical protein ASE36_02110 [Rhizobium sp. Root274]
MTEAGHDDRTLLDTLSLREEEDDCDLEVEDLPRVAEPRRRIVAQGLIIGHLLPHLADPDAADSLDLRPGLTRHYFEV